MDVPQIVTEQGAVVSVLLYVGGGLGALMVTGLTYVCRILWSEVKDLRKDKQENEKANLELFNKIIESHKDQGGMVTKIDTDINALSNSIEKNITPNIQEIRDKIIAMVIKDEKN